MEYVIGALAIWFLGTFPATHMAAVRVEKWNADESDVNTEDRVLLFIALWPIVVIAHVAARVVPFLIWPFVAAHFAVWSRARRRTKSDD